MNNNASVEGYRGFALQRLRELLPDLFTLHHRLLSIADPKTKEIKRSLDELAKVFNCNHFQLYSYLLNLQDLRFIDCPRVFEFNQKIIIKILVITNQPLSSTYAKLSPTVESPRKNNLANGC